MAKDPAFLLYYQDFSFGTRFMSLAAKGAYIDVLCWLADKRSISKQHMLIICQSNESVMNEILPKMEVDSDGLFFNKRLREEVEKRKSYTESRRINRLNGSKKTKPKPKKKQKSYDEHMEDENENGIVVNTINVSEISFEEIKPFVDIKIMRKDLKPEHSLNIWNEFIQREQDTKFDDMSHVRRMLEAYITKTDWSYLVKAGGEWLYGNGATGYYKYQLLDGKMVNQKPVERSEYLNNKK